MDTASYLDTDYHFSSYTLDIRVNLLDPLIELIILCIFISGILVLAYWHSEGVFGSVANILRHSEISPWSLHDFLHLKEAESDSQKKYIFSEETVMSIGHRFTGRFDAAVLHWEEVPILDALIERKFPINRLPKKKREEDFFQAGLYALALLETGVSCSGAWLLLIYCLQSDAKRCLDKNRVDCIHCGSNVVHQRKFNQKRVLQALRRLDEVWYNGRRPRASPSIEKCRPCPYGSNRQCNHSVL
ncbi:MAG: hypothetical protein ACFE7R_05340 [Candidatus Hodarchaeota archaeon]